MWKICFSTRLLNAVGLSFTIVGEDFLLSESSHSSRYSPDR